jgi:hypothetical protein
MTTLRLTVALAALITFSGICFSGCGSSSGPLPKVEDVTGKWVAIKKENYALGGGQQVGFVIEFLSDMSVMLPSGKGSWEILKDGRVKIDLSGITMHGSLQGNILTLTMADNQSKVILKKQ